MMIRALMCFPLALLVLDARADADSPKKIEKPSAPHIASVSPAVGAVGVAPTLREIRVTFDQPMSRRGYSVSSQGPEFPRLTGLPRWADAYTCVFPVRLRPNREYRLIINGPGAEEGFRSIWLIPAETTTCHFKTGGMGAIQRDPIEQRKLNIESLDALADAMRNRYAYLETRKIGWEVLLADHRREIGRATTTDDWVKRVADMLRQLRDVDLTLKIDGLTVPTFVGETTPNQDWKGTQRLIPNVQWRNPHVAAGMTEDDIGYILIGSLANRAASDLQQVHRVFQEFSHARAMVIDVRSNAGGSETLAEDLAARFVVEPRVYGQRVYRRGPGPEDFTSARLLTIEPKDPPDRYAGPVAVLMGKVNRGASETFLLMMKQAPNVTLIGEPSCGCWGNTHAVFLPNGVQASIPSAKALDPTGVALDVNGIPPDVVVPREGVDFSQHDPVLAEALRVLRKPR